MTSNNTTANNKRNRTSKKKSDELEREMGPHQPDGGTENESEQNRTNSATESIDDTAIQQGKTIKKVITAAHEEAVRHGLAQREEFELLSLDTQSFQNLHDAAQDSTSVDITRAFGQRIERATSGPDYTFNEQGLAFAQIQELLGRVSFDRRDGQLYDEWWSDNEPLINRIDCLRSVVLREFTIAVEISPDLLREIIEVLNIAAGRKIYNLDIPNDDTTDDGTSEQVDDNTDSDVELESINVNPSDRLVIHFKSGPVARNDDLRHRIEQHLNRNKNQLPRPLDLAGIYTERAWFDNPSEYVYYPEDGQPMTLREFEGAVICGEVPEIKAAGVGLSTAIATELDNVFDHVYIKKGRWENRTVATIEN